MKHLFVLHSAITEIVMWEVVKYKNIPSEDLIIVVARNYKLIGRNYNKTHTLPFNYYIVRNPALNFNNRIRWFADFKKNVCNEKYIAYVPHTNELNFALIVTNSKCCEYNYIEEGLLNYYHFDNKFSFNKLYIILKRKIQLCSLTLPNFIIKDRYFDYRHPKLNSCYGLSSESFIEAKNRIIFDFIKIDLLEIVDITKYEKKFDAIIVFDALAIYNLINFDEIFELLKSNIFNVIQENCYKIIGYKFHPEHYFNIAGKKEMDIINSYFRDLENKYNFSFIEISQDFSIEVYCSLKKPDIFTFISSLGYYSFLLGCKSYNLGDTLLAINKDLEIETKFIKKFIQI